MVILADREILNFNSVEEDLLMSRNNRDVQLSIPSVNRRKMIKSKQLNNLKDDILDFSKSLPHKRIVLTYKTLDEEIILEIHPVTGAA